MTLCIRVDDVGRKSGDIPAYGSDGNLEWFFKWRHALRLHRLPRVYYGVTASWLALEGLNKLSRLGQNEHLAVHGWSHSDYPAREDMLSAKRVLEVIGRGVDAYIPPSNKYTQESVKDWKEVGGSVFFGDAPQIPVSGMTFIPITQDLYGHTPEIIKELKRNVYRPDGTCITLHVPWDSPANMEELRKLGDLLYQNCER